MNSFQRFCLRSAQKPPASFGVSHRYRGNSYNFADVCSRMVRASHLNQLIRPHGSMYDIQLREALMLACVQCM